MRCSNENADIFTAREKTIWYLPKKKKKINFFILYNRPNSDVIMFDVDVTRCVAVFFFTNIFHLKSLKPFEKCFSTKIAKKLLFC